MIADEQIDPITFKLDSKDTNLSHLEIPQSVLNTPAFNYHIPFDDIKQRVELYRKKEKMKRKKQQQQQQQQSSNDPNSNHISNDLNDPNDPNGEVNHQDWWKRPEELIRRTDLFDSNEAEESLLSNIQDKAACRLKAMTLLLTLRRQQKLSQTGPVDVRVLMKQKQNPKQPF